MNRADERALAWDLADAAAPYLSTAARVRLNMMIGAGEFDGAVLELLAFYAHTGTAISGGLFNALEAWVFGYTGTAAGERLRLLMDRVPEGLSRESSLLSRHDTSRQGGNR